MAFSNNKIYGLSLTGGTIYSGATELSLLFPSGGGSGEINTASSLGTGNPVFAQKSGVDLQFRTLVAGSNITITSGATTLTITSSATSTGTTNNAWMTSPEYYYAGITGHQNITFAGAGKNQTFIDANFPGIGATTSDNVDWAALQVSLNEAISTGKVMYLYGDYYINTGLTMTKYFNRLTIEGNGAKIYTTNSNAYTMLGRIPPTGNTEALNFMTSAKIQIRHIDFIGQSQNQIGYYSGPSYGASYEGLRFTSVGMGILLRFSLNTMVKNCQFFACNSGATATMGDWVYDSSSPLSGETATNSNSQSNVTTFEHCRAYMTGGNYGFGIFAASGCRITDAIIEGSQCRNAIEFDAYGSVNVYSFWCQNIHAELSYDSADGEPGTGTLSIGTGTKVITVNTGICNSEYPAGYPIRLTSPGNGYMDGTVTSYIGTTLTVNITTANGSGTYSDYNVVILLGTTNSIIKHRSLAGIFSLDGLYSQYRAICVDAYATLSNANVKVSNIYSVVPDHNGKYFRSRTTAQAWYFDWCDQLYSDVADMTNKFAIDNGVYSNQPIGVAATSATLGSTGNGNNRYIIVPSPR